MILEKFIISLHKNQARFYLFSDFLQAEQPHAQNEFVGTEESKLTTFCIHENEDMYSIYKPSCTRDEMFSSLVIIETMTRRTHRTR